jgi:hypothetical protein
MVMNNLVFCLLMRNRALRATSRFYLGLLDHYITTYNQCSSRMFTMRYTARMYVLAAARASSRLPSSAVQRAPPAQGQRVCAH